ncbi:DUF3313 domain-containing protein [Mesorhizobium sp. CA13]|uniref:DUF3313 domain-containing protein n=1 Tax=Mesorhizobium sp. CA13 TaxID=2876643 RepID=UPI001CCAC7A8|nr:DUF3313 domain-containing protein [Mesorhizobium sp. CA13]MBZ9854690.1 DUF3313 domain-containing protein [Mesorhizobium sp. CA13]
MLRLKIACIGLSLALAGCSSVPLKEAGTLTSYNQLGPAKGKFNKSRTFVDAKALGSIRSVSISPTVFSPSAASRVKEARDRALVLNALDRAMCVALSDKYQVVPAGQPSDLTVKTVIADLVPTDKITAGVSKAVSLGSSAVLPVSIPRLPLGFGGLAVEAEALDRNGTQRAAMVWSRGANSFTTEARVSEIGDAYSLGTTFGNDFSRMLVTGKAPSGWHISIPSGQRIKSFLGGKPKYAACEVFGRAPGLFGMVGAKVGAPPSWTDKSAKTRPTSLAVQGPPATLQ